MKRIKNKDNDAKSLEEVDKVEEPDFENMTGAQIIRWFRDHRR